MARKRMVDPCLFTSESVAALPITTRYTWVGLWTYLDDTGRGKDNAQLVKAAVWPLDDAMTAKKVRLELDRLVAGGQLCAFECCGTSQIHSPTWTAWQKISHPTETKLCACPLHERAAHEIHRRETGMAPESLAKDSGAALPSVVKVSREKSSSGAGGVECEHDSARDLCPLCRSSAIRAAS